MPRRDARMYLVDILDACAALHSHVGDHDEAAFRNTRIVRAAVEREFSIICEAVVQLIKLDPSIAGRISDSRGIAHFRNILIHAYDLVDPARMWSIVREDIPTLRREVLLLLEEHRGS